MDLKRVCSDESCSGTVAKSSCDGSAQKAMRRPKLRALMQLPLPQNSSVSQIDTSEYLERQEQENSEQLEAVPKQYERSGIWKCVKGICWSSLFKPRDTGNNKPQRNNNGGAFAKLTKLWKKMKRPPGSGNVKVELKTSFGVERDDEHSCKSSSDEKHIIEENDLVDDGDKAGCKTSSFDTHKAEKEESAMKNLPQNDSTNLDLLFDDHMLAKSSDGGFAEKSSPRNASALICAEYGSPIQNAAAASMSQSKIWEYFELNDVWTEREEILKKQAAAEEERLKKEAVTKEYKW